VLPEMTVASRAEKRMAIRMESFRSRFAV